MLDLECVKSGELLPADEQANAGGGISCPGCGRGVGTFRESEGWRYEVHRKMGDTENRRALHDEAEVTKKLIVLSHELERWRVESERALVELDDLDDEADVDEVELAREAYEHCLAKFEEVACQIDALEHPEKCR